MSRKISHLGVRYLLYFPFMKLGMFRTFLLAGLISGVALVPAPATQVLNCTARGTAATPLRAEGNTELVGDIIIQCTGGTPTASGAPVPTTDLTVYLNTAITSRLYANGWSDALLIIDDPTTSAQLACADPNGICTITGTGTGVGTYDGTAGRPNIFLGRGGGSSVVFPSVPFDPPGAGSRFIRITNLRTNAPPPGSEVSFYVTGNPIFSLSIAQSIVGDVQSSAAFSLRSPDNSSVANGSGTVVSQCGAAQRVAVFRAAELSGTAFRKRTFAAFVDSETSPAPAAQDVVGGIYNSESGFYNPALTAPTVDFTTVGLADASTRLRAVLSNIPLGSKVFVSTTNVVFSGGNPSAVSAGSVARLVVNEATAFVPMAATGTLEGVATAQLPVVNGIATAVWEVLGTNPGALENFDFAIWVQSGPNAGTATLAGSYAPAPPAFEIAGAGQASATLPIPRFVDIASAVPVFDTSACAVAASTSTALTATATGAPSQYTLSATATTPDPATYGQPAGTVTFYDGGSPIARSATSLAAGGTASFVTVLLGGAHSLTAVFIPSDLQRFSPSTSPAVALTAPATATSTALTTATSDGSQYGLTATVTAIVGVPAGSVTFYDGGTAIANSTTSLNGGGTAVLNTRLVGGGHSLTAVFTPSNPQIFAASTSAAVPLTVAATLTWTALIPTPTGATNEYRLAAVVAALVGVPTGTVAFYDNGTAIPGSTTTLPAGGTASFNAVLAVGAHILTAVFTPSNSAMFAASTSPAVSLSIGPASTSVQIASSIYPSLPGQAVTFTATVTASGGNVSPTGTVQFADGSQSLGSAALVGGQASVTATLTTVGTHDIWATYGGDAGDQASSARFAQRVDRLTDSLSLATSAASAAFGQTVTLTATLGPAAPSGVAAATGTVQFLDGSSVIGTVALSSRTAVLAVSNLAAGSHQIVAIYGGDATWYGNSAAVAVTVAIGTTSTALTSSSTLTQVLLSAAVTPAASGGSVQFLDATANTVLGTVPLVNGAATLALTPADAANIAGHSIQAVYFGSAGLAGSTSNTLALPGLGNAAGGASAQFAPDELVSVFGANLAAVTQSANAATLPQSLGGVSVSVTDATGATVPCGLSYVSPSQVNFLVPSSLAPGAALVTVTRSGAAVATMPVTIAPVAPGLFAASQMVNGDGGALYLVLYGTGIRNRSASSAVTCMVNGTALPVIYAGTQPDYPGLDQVNVLLPASVRGAATLSVSLMVDGLSSNTITVAMQ